MSSTGSRSLKATRTRTRKAAGSGPAKADGGPAANVDGGPPATVDGGTAAAVDGGADANVDSPPAATVDGGTAGPAEGASRATVVDGGTRAPSTGRRRVLAPLADGVAATGDPAATSEPHRRSSAYRAETREAASTAYHADALVMARMGYVPESEAWSTQLQQVLEVGYVHAPDRTAAVLQAVTQAAADQGANPTPTPAAPGPRPEIWRPDTETVFVARLLVGALGGAAAGAAICLALAWVSGESVNAIILGGFALLGLILGSFAGLAPD